MKQLILFMLIIFQFICTLQAQEIEIKASRMHGLLVFVYANAGLKHYSPYIKTFTEKSSLSEQMKTAIGDFSKLERSLSKGSSYREEGIGYGDGFTVLEITEIQSAYATDIDDLMLRIVHLLPIEDWLTFRQILRASEPIYEKLIWSVYKSELLTTEKLFQSKISQWQLAQNFAKAEKFYNSTWPKDFKFLVTLYPIPKGSTHSNAHSLSSFESVGIIMGDTDTAGQFGVIFHEMMHSLYAAQKIEFKQKLYSYFELDKKDSEFAYRKGAQYFSNEIYAAILGNGWFYEIATGAADKHDWYNEKHINAMARAMYSTTKDYLNTGRSIDKNYIQKLNSEFKNSFPKFHIDPEYLLQSVELLHTSQFFKSADIKKSLRAQFRVPSLGIGGNSNLLKEKIQISKDENTTFVLLSTAEAKKINKKISILLDLPTKLLKSVAQLGVGVWVWTDKNGNTRMLGVTEAGKLDDLFKNEVVEIK